MERGYADPAGGGQPVHLYVAAATIGTFQKTHEMKSKLKVRGRGVWSKRFISKVFTIKNYNI